MATVENDKTGKEEDERFRTLVHDIRNPLSSIYLTIDSLRNAIEDKEDPAFYIDLLEKSARKMEEILVAASK